MGGWAVLTPGDHLGIELQKRRRRLRLRVLHQLLAITEAEAWFTLDASHVASLAGEKAV